MKKIFALLLCLSLAICAGAQTLAADPEILKGTPTIDGKLDDIYKQSISVTNDASVKLNGTDVAKAAEMKGTAYLLYDDNFLYMCTEVNDATLMTRTDEYFKEANNWKNDAVENYVDFTATISAVSDPYKIALDAYAKKIYGGDSIKNAKYAATQGKETYTVEIAIPIQGKKTGDVIIYALQVNNQVVAEGTSMVHFRTNPVKYTLSSKSVTLPKVETKVVETTTASAKTADPAVFALIAAAVSMAGIAVSKKRYNT